MNLLWFLVEALCLVCRGRWRLEGLWEQVLSCYPLVYSGVMEFSCGADLPGLPAII